MSDAQAPTSTGGCLVHIFRCLVGPGFFLAFGGLLLIERPPRIGLMDIAFLAAGSVLITSAFLDPYSFGESSQEPSRPRRVDRSRYAIIVSMLMIVLFVLRLAFRSEGTTP